MAEGETERTLLLVKPDGVQRGLVGEIVARLERKGLKIVGLEMLQVPSAMAERQYAEHAGKPFHPGLLAHIISGPTVAVAIEGRSAVSVVRLMIGATNPQTAAPGTIRGDLGLAITPNLVHASDSLASAKRELELFFPKGAFLTYSRTDERYM